MMVSDLKKRAAEEFTHLLLASEVREEIVKIILFGSVLRGEAKEESDIDLLVIASGNLDKVRDASAESSFQTWLKFHQGVEPLVYCVDSMRFHSSGFLKQVFQKGKEIFSMGEDERLKKEAKDYLSLAEQYLESAKRNLSEKDFRAAIDLAYNSSELCAKALILLKGADIPGSHGGVVNKFGELYVVSGEIPKDLGRALNRTLELRNRARYDPHAEITPEGSKEVIELAKRILKFLDDKLK
jgi:uncharacterized protein (UPF0332 family)/predicted nucleotidyltransferase